ncbi:MAG: hypothetical protein VX930_07355, partial [Pseudomonadota bacterium]|nr:hypothetical protein [Pseudomonadota bacterium]
RGAIAVAVSHALCGRFAGNVIRYLVFAVAIALAEMIILMNSPKVPDCSPKLKLTKTGCN